MRIFRIALMVVGTLIALVVIANLTARGYGRYRVSALSTSFREAHPEAASLPAHERVALKGREVAARVDSTRYSHWTSIDESAGRYLTDCSGLVCFLLRNAAPESYRSLPVKWYAHRPQASKFYEAFVSAPDSTGAGGWQRIRRLEDARPGDIIAWADPEHRFWENTGHVVVVIDTPVVESGGDTVRVKLLESGGGRRIDDSNKPNNWGVGTGIARLAVDASGELKGNGAIGRPVD